MCQILCDDVKKPSTEVVEFQFSGKILAVFFSLKPGVILKIVC